MLLFARNRELSVQSFIVKLLNNNCAELKATIGGPRLDCRVNLTMVVLVIPVEGGRPQLRKAFTAVTKEFSNMGVAIVLERPLGLDEVIVGFRWEGEMTFVRGKAKHLNPLGGGFHQLGFRLTEVLPVADYPELKSLSL